MKTKIGKLKVFKDGEEWTWEIEGASFGSGVGPTMSKTRAEAKKEAATVLAFGFSELV